MLPGGDADGGRRCTSAGSRVPLPGPPAPSGHRPSTDAASPPAGTAATRAAAPAAGAMPPQPDHRAGARATAATAATAGSPFTATAAQTRLLLGAQGRWLPAALRQPEPGGRCPQAGAGRRQDRGRGGAGQPSPLMP